MERIRKPLLGAIFYTLNLALVLFMNLQEIPADDTIYEQSVPAFRAFCQYFNWVATELDVENAPMTLVLN